MGSHCVALRKESVDRNGHWEGDTVYSGKVALRKESVDRNRAYDSWAESVADVALRKESVDRNVEAAEKQAEAGSRSPQGERG